MLPLPLRSNTRNTPPPREQGQDIIEYSLLLALIFIGAVAWFVVSSRDIGSVRSGGGNAGGNGKGKGK